MCVAKVNLEAAQSLDYEIKKSSFMSLIADDVANSGRNIFAESPLLADNVLLARLKVHGCSAHSLEARHSIRKKKLPRE